MKNIYTQLTRLQYLIHSSKNSLAPVIKLNAQSRFHVVVLCSSNHYLTQITKSPAFNGANQDPTSKIRLSDMLLLQTVVN